MGSQQLFCLRWSNHQSNMLSVFDELLQHEALVDVTIACEGLSMKAHRVVLSACSPYFQTLFLENPCKHPIVILKDIKFHELKALVDFMYKGEVNVTQEQLSALLKTAEALKIKGLAEVTGGVNGQQSDGDRSSPVRVERAPPPTQLLSSAVPSQLAADLRTGGSPRPLPGQYPASAALRLIPNVLPGSLSMSAVVSSPSSVSQVMARSPRSPLSKRKKLRHRRPSSEPGQSDSEEAECIEMHGSPEMIEAKVEVTSPVDFDETPNTTTDNETERAEHSRDLQPTDSNQGSLDMVYSNQGPSSEGYLPIGEPMPALSSLPPVSLLPKLKSPGASTSSGPSGQGDSSFASGVRHEFSGGGGGGYVPKRGQPRILNEEEEVMIVTYIMEMAAKGRPVTRRCVLEYGNTLLRREDRIPTGSIHCNPEKGLSNDWWKEFKKRHPGLPVRAPSSSGMSQSQPPGSEWASRMVEDSEGDCPKDQLD